MPMRLQSVELVYCNKTMTIVECKSVVEVYNNKEGWAHYKDNHQFYFHGGTKGVLKKFRIRHTYIDPDVVQSIEDLRTACTDINRPSRVSVIIPLMPTVGLDGVMSTHFLDCSDCNNIIKVAKRDFQRNEIMGEVGSNSRFTFDFGEMVLDSKTKETAIVVGQTKAYTYVVTESSIFENTRSQVSIIPKRKCTKRFSTIISTKVLNFKVVQQCGLMEEYIVPNSEGPYN